jgi:hypothetical protein
MDYHLQSKPTVSALQQRSVTSAPLRVGLRIVVTATTSLPVTVAARGDSTLFGALVLSVSACARAGVVGDAIARGGEPIGDERGGEPTNTDDDVVVVALAPVLGTAIALLAGALPVVTDVVLVADVDVGAGLRGAGAAGIGKLDARGDIDDVCRTHHGHAVRVVLAHRRTVFVSFAAANCSIMYLALTNCTQYRDTNMRSNRASTLARAQLHWHQTRAS